MKTNFLYDFCFLELLICLCDISYCFQVHWGYSLPMLLLNSFFSSFKSNKLVPNNLSEWTTEQKKNTYWKNHFSTCELTRVCESLLPSSVKSLTITNYSLWWLKRKKKSWTIKTTLCFCCETPVSSLVNQWLEYLNSPCISFFSVILSDFVLMTYCPLNISLNYV